MIRRISHSARHRRINDSNASRLLASDIVSRILARLCALVLAASLVLLALGSGALAAPRRQPAAASRVVSIARQAMRRYDLKAVILRVLAGHRPLATAALGESMAGVPA